MPEKLHGHCFCSRIQYEIILPIRMFSHCHCESCRRSHAAAFVSWIAVSHNQLKVTTGENLLKTYESSQDIYWRFCTNCGTQLFQTTRYSPDLSFVGAGTLVDSFDEKATGHMCYGERVSWLDIRDDLPKVVERSSAVLS